MMAVLKVILMIVYIIICIALTIIVLMQEGKQAGLTAAVLILIGEGIKAVLGKVY